MNYAVFVSGKGGFSKVLYKNRHLINNGNLSLIISDRHCEGIEYFRDSTNISSYLVDYSSINSTSQFEKNIYELLVKHKVDFIFLNFDRIISKYLIDKFPNKIFNLHLSLLPLFRGLNAIKKSFDSNMLFYGSTFHIVDESVDGGPVLGQLILGRDFEDSIERYTDKLFKNTAFFFVNMVYNVLNYEIVTENNFAYFEGLSAEHRTAHFPRFNIPENYIEL